MNKITSFCVNHDVLKEGMYVSRVDGDIITYDLRLVLPNAGVYLENDGIHTFEHLFATYVRNSIHSDKIIYAGPMGCRTGFYFLTRDTLSKEEAIQLVKETIAFIRDFQGDIPGASNTKECGNYLDHSLEKANTYAKQYYEVMKNWKVDNLSYAE